MDDRRQLTGGRPTLSDELDAAREAAFVGRAADLAAFAASLSGAEPTRVHFLHGPGGIGKSTLLDAMARMALRDHRHVVRLDGTVVARGPATRGVWSTSRSARRVAARCWWTTSTGSPRGRTGSARTSCPVAPRTW